MDSPALLVAIAMLAAGAIATLGGLAVAGFLWQVSARGDEAGLEPLVRPAAPAYLAARPVRSATLDDVDDAAAPAGAGLGEPPVVGPAIRIPRPRRTARAGARSTGTAAPSRQMRLGAYALAAAERAAQARTEAEAARDEATRAQFARDEAWRALEAADEQPVSVAPPTETAAVDPAVTQAAFAAFRRGDITVEELRRVWGRPEERDPGAAAQERERRQRMALSRSARRAYEQASAAARVAEEKAQVADVAAMALATEAEEAAADAAAVTTG